MMPKLRIRPKDREEHPDWYSRSELKQKKLMPASGAAAVAYVHRTGYSDYLLFDIKDAVPFQKSEKEKEKERERARARRALKRRLAEQAELRKLAREAMAKIPETLTSVYELVVLDFETTGIDPRSSEVLQVAVIDQDGNVLMQELCKPVVAESWDDAEAIHGISPGMVAGCQPFEAFIPRLAELLFGANWVLAYNKDFEAGFLADYGLDVLRLNWADDPMLLFCELQELERWQKLGTVAAHYGYAFQAHDALEDVRATLFVYQRMMDELKSKDQLESERRHEVKDEN